MAESYVTLGEAAELEGIGYETMKKKVQRNQKQYCARQEKREDGGKDVVLVAVLLLPIYPARKLIRLIVTE